MTRLNKKDWQQLDVLLSKMGFGGYYDVAECLKMSIRDISKIVDIEKPTEFLNKVSEEKDLQILVSLLNTITSKINRE